VPAEQRQLADNGSNLVVNCVGDRLHNDRLGPSLLGRWYQDHPVTDANAAGSACALPRHLTRALHYEAPHATILESICPPGAAIRAKTHLGPARTLPGHRCHVEG